MLASLGFTRTGPGPLGVTYDPWLHLWRRWPSAQVEFVPLPDDLLGDVGGDPPLVRLRTGSSAAEVRCTLAHEIVHLERGLLDCGPWQSREEVQVHRQAAARLIHPLALVAAVRDLGGDGDRSALAALLNVDRDTLQVRIDSLDRDERQLLRRALRSEWSATA